MNGLEFCFLKGFVVVGFFCVFRWELVYRFYKGNIFYFCGVVEDVLKLFLICFVLFLNNGMDLGLIVRRCCFLLGGM